MTEVNRVLISVSDKTGIVEFAGALAGMGVQILSTGGTARWLRGNAVRVTEVSDYTGFPEIMDGRLKTLHPKIHGALLGRRAVDAAVMAKHGIEPIDMVVVNLYPFERAVADPFCDFAVAVENIDVGGPAMLRAAAKNHAEVAVIVDPDDYAAILEELGPSRQLSPATRRRLATKAFEQTARYDGAIADYLGGIADDGTRRAFPRTWNRQYHLSQEMRYGENPHQRAAFYVDPSPDEASVSTSEQLQGKALSYNNVADLDAALECARAFAVPVCVIVKHANPCGVALGQDCHQVCERAFSADPASAFGGIIAFNRRVDIRAASVIVGRRFVEAVIAPSFEPEALREMARKRDLRVLACGDLGSPRVPARDLKRVNGGLLVQERDLGEVTDRALKVVTKRVPSEAERADLLFAWRVARHVKSNAIVYARNGMTIGIGAGQMSRVDSARIAAFKATEAGWEVKGSVLASDAFFPFRDAVDTAADAGIGAIIQPGGSIRDEEIIAAADERDIAMVFTGMRHFRH